MKGTDYFREYLGIKVLEVKDGYAKVSMEIAKEHTNSLGAAHGGAIFVAVQVSINFLKPAFEGDTLTAEAVRASEGKTLGLYHVTIYNQDKKIAFFSGLAFKT